MLLLPLLAFLFASLLVAGTALAMRPRASAAIEQRLGEISGTETRIAEPARYRTLMLDTVKRIGNVAPTSSSEMSKLRQKLVCAGYRGSEALTVFTGIRLGCAVACFGVALMFRMNLALALPIAAVGYLLPSMVLGRIAKRRQHRIRMALPDALDLLVVSVEAGLGLDQAIQRVGEELRLTHPDLSSELRLINLELRAGTARAEALHNLAERTQVDDLTSLVATLVQTDKFGTSVAQSLRVHSDTLRTKRRQRAEEAAAKTGVKMVFPLVFCIFPAIWVVTIGPAAIKFVQVLGPMSQGGR